MTMSTSIDLDATDFRRLIGGRSVTKYYAGYRVRLTARDVSAKALMTIVLAEMGDDPPEAKELSRPRK